MAQDTPAESSGASSANAPANESEWIRVKPKSRRSRRRQVDQQQQHIESESVPRVRTGPLRPMAEIEADYRKFQTRWLESATYSSLGQIIETVASSTGEITKAVCLGIGSFDPPDGAWEDKQTAFFQLLAFQTMIDGLAKHTKSPIPCYFQEPIFTAPDKEFIQALGHHVVESPGVYDMMGPETFFFGVHLYRGVYAKSLEVSSPAVFVGTDWSAWDMLYSSQAAELHKLEDMDSNYSKASFPEGGCGNAFSSTSIYWRPSSLDNSVDDLRAESSGA